MTVMDEVPVTTTAECIIVLRRVLHCLDDALPLQEPEEADRFALAATYIQQVIDLLD